MNSAELASFVHPGGRCSDPAAFLKLGANFGLEPAGPPDYAEIVDLACSAIPGATLTTDSLSLVQGITRCGVLMMREDDRVTGMIASIPLREAGRQACEEGWFDPASLDPAMIARPHETPATFYGWGFVGVTEQARKAVVKFAVAGDKTLCWALDTYSRPVTPDGERVVVASLGYEFIGKNRLARKAARGFPLDGVSGVAA